MARKIGIGVVSAGGIAGIEHIPNLLRLKPQFEVAGVCDPSATARGFVTGHSAFAGSGPLSLIEAHVKRAVPVHCKDTRKAVVERARREHMSFMGAVMEGIFTVLGDRLIDYAPILRVLAEADCSGWLAAEAEQDPKKAHPLTYAKMGFENPSRLAKAAGFTVDN